MFQDDGTGKFDVVTSMIDFLCETGVLEASGSRVTWDGKSFYRKQLAEKIEKEGLLAELMALLPEPTEAKVAVEPEVE
jgi:hypothetical protein